MRAVMLLMMATGAACLLIPVHATAQPLNSMLTRGHRANVDTNRVSTCHANDPEPMIGYEGMMGPDHGGRAYAGLNLTGAQIPFFTTAAVFDHRSGKTRISSNAIFSGLGILGVLPRRC